MLAMFDKTTTFPTLQANIAMAYLRYNQLPRTLATHKKQPANGARQSGATHGGLCSYKRSDKQIGVRMLRRAQEGGDAADLHAVEQLLPADPHDVHGHLAGDDAHAVLHGGLNQFFQR